MKNGIIGKVLAILKPNLSDWLGEMLVF